MNDSIRTVRNSNAELTDDPGEIASTLNKYFQEVFVIEEGESHSFNVDLEMNVNDFVDMDPEKITYSLVALKLGKLNQNKTCGADKLHPKILKNCTEAFADHVQLISWTLDFISYYLEKCIPVDVIMLDFAKVFDTVPHRYRRLLATLKAYGINGSV